MDIRKYGNSQGLSDHEIETALIDSLKGQTLKKVLLIPPDITRFHSYAGTITNMYYHLLKDRCNHIDILPALGTHVPMPKDELEEMFGDIPYESFLIHDWRNEVIKIGEVPSEFVSEITENYWMEKVTIEINQLIMNGDYDLILSIGQVVPHEVIGMANHSKNLLVGCGGRKTINESHMIGAVYGMERMMGKDHTPVRKILDYALENFLNHLPIVFVLTVTTAVKNDVTVHGLFIGPKRETFEAAVELAQQKNIDFLEEPIETCVVYLDPKEFKSTWLGNKAIYRTRMAIKDAGNLIILAPGVTRFGEDLKIDELIRKYGYTGRDQVLKDFHQNEDLKQNMSAAAHLIHGSSDGRFNITYAVKGLSKEEVEQVKFQYASYDEMIKKYNPDTLAYGWNTLEDGSKIFYIPNPALGLWIDKNKF
ncbi:MAG: lactate racemase domain-containing protein [Candidatus Izemoplasmataceae bacterium]